ncbi:MAG TPA: glycosyltransferase family 9 protein [Casimicrobiaceae bacterium]|jgi:ADP-heptose:LPS heptosyltransferase
MNSRGPSRWLVLPLAAGQIAVSAIGRQRIAPQVPERVLIAHDLLLGDTIMLTPLLAKCRERWPSADIVMTCAPSYCGLYAMRPYGVRVLPYDPRDLQSLQRLRAEAPFDLALIPGDNRYSWLARALRARWVVGFSGADARYKDWPIDELRSYPDVPTAWADLAAGLIDGPAPARYRMTHWPTPPAAAFEAPAEPYCVIHAGASSALKRWPADRWSEVARRLETMDLRIVLSAGPGEVHLLDAIDPVRAFPRFGGNLSLPQMWHLLERAKLLIAPDTGIAHLGRLVGVPTLALFGPGSALLSGAGDFWRDSPFTALTIPDFPCRDQTITMRRDVRWIRRCERFQGTAPGQCPEARCMLALSTDDVGRAAVQLLSTPSSHARPATIGASA